MKKEEEEKLTSFLLSLEKTPPQADNDMMPPAPRSSDPFSASSSNEGMFGLLDVEDAGAPALEVFVREEGEEGGQPFPSASSSKSTSSSSPPSKKRNKLGPLISQATVLRARGLGLPVLDGEGAEVADLVTGDEDDDDDGGGGFGGIAELLLANGIRGRGGGGRGGGGGGFSGRGRGRF